MSEQPTHYGTITATREGVKVTYPKKRNATNEILKALQSGERLSGRDIWLRFRVYRASSIINKLKKKGYNIPNATMVKDPDGTWYGVYHLE